jgi:hypothetical protein
MRARSNGEPAGSHHQAVLQRGNDGGPRGQVMPDGRPEQAQRESLLQLMATSPRLQRQCACGAPSAGGGSCAACEATAAASPHPLQRKPLEIGAADDPLEREADRVAERVMRMEAMPETPLPLAVSNGPMVAPSGRGAAASGEAPPSVHAALAMPGQPLDASARAFFEPRFGVDLSGVRVHTDALAQQSALDVNALAYTVGSHLVFGAGRYAPESLGGQQLLAHELAHTLQQQQSLQVQRYTAAERRAMTEGQITARQSDLDLASQRHFQPGDIVFRLGSRPLGLLMGEPVTHGGIYIGDGLIHDVVGFGNRHVRVADFFSRALGEATDPSVYRLVRFQGPHRDLIVARLLSNIRLRDFRMPTDPVPFNLFSSSNDYRTATCLEYTHAQFLYAIRQLATDPSISPSDRESIRRIYFTGSAAEPNALIQPQEQRLIGNWPVPESSDRRHLPPRTPGALLQEAALVAAASALADDVDPTRFRNRSESRYTEHWPGGDGIGGAIINFLSGGPSYDEVVLQTFTYRSFVDSRQFFQDVTSP